MSDGGDTCPSSTKKCGFAFPKYTNCVPNNNNKKIAEMKATANSDFLFTGNPVEQLKLSAIKAFLS